MKKRNAVAVFRRTAISVAVGMCIAGVVHAQGADGNIVGTAKAGATVTLTGPKGETNRATARPDGTFSFPRLAPGTYKVTSDGVTKDVIVAAGVDSRVALETAAVEKITVTGSRIARDTFNSASPVQVITRDETLMSGFASTTAALQSTSVTAGSAQINNAFGGFVTDGGPGSNTLSLRGLGATRTLVLLNGRRVAPAGSRGSVGSADLNVLPSSVVDRVEVLKDGASSIYGSDAVAGVVNIITRKNIQGVTVEAQYNSPENGGGEERRVSATFGFTGDRGFISGSLEAYDRNAVLWGDRDWMKCQTDYRRRVTNGVPGEWGSLDFIDPLTGQPKCYTITGTGNDGVTINTIGTGNLAGVPAAGAVGTTFNRWRPNSGVTTGLAGFEGVGGGTNSLNVRDTFDPRMMNQTLISPVEIQTAFLQGGYDLKAMGNAEAYFEALISRRDSSQVGYRQLSLDYARGSPLIPAGLASVPNLQSAPTVLTYGQPLQIRAFIGFGNYNSQQEVDYDKFTGGLRGDLPWSDWKYDFYGSYAKSDATYMFEQWLTNRLAQSMDVVAGPNGTFVCRDPSNGCVAAPALSSAVIGGVLPRDWVNWTFVPDTGHTKYKETTAVLNTSGTLFAMAHGDARGAIGLEWREAEIDDTPSINMQNANVYNFSSAAITRGKDSVKEVYGEIELPLLRGLKGAEELTVNLSGRWTDYKSYGSDTTYKAGVLYSPVNWLSFRAAQGTSYRAPALFEQFLGATSGFISSQNDPCNNWGAGDPTSTRAQNCASEGLPPNFQATSSVQVNSVGGAEAGLKAETSKNVTLGMVLQPMLPTGWGDVSLALDYYDIEVDNGVARAGATAILSLCYDDPGFIAAGGFCRLITRAGPGTNRQLTVDNSYINLSKDIVKGYDLTLRYVRNVGQGQVIVNGLVSKYDEQAGRLFPDDPLESVNGIIGAPDMTANLDVTYRYQGWRFRYGMEWIDSMSSYEYYGQNPDTSTYQMKTPSYALHNASVEYTADKWSIIAGVRNLSDKEPPSISQGFANRRGNAPLYSGFDYFGRTYFVNARYSF
jgi:outer membrane receptor protein involved in Fe transport